MPRSPFVPPKRIFADQVLEQMAAFGLVQARPMFGGFGMFLDGLMFAVAIKETLYFKADEQTRDEFVQLGLRPFSYASRGKTVQLHYYEAPPEVFDDVACMTRWCRLAFECALRKRPARGQARR